MSTLTPTNNATTLDLVSTGKLTCDLQRSPREIAKAAVDLGIVAAIKLNGVPYLSLDDAERIAGWFRERADQRGASPREQAGV